MPGVLFIALGSWGDVTTGHLLDAPDSQPGPVPPGLPEFLDEHPGAIHLASAITRAVGDPSYARSAQALAARMRTEDGPAAAAAILAAMSR